MVFEYETFDSLIELVNSTPDRPRSLIDDSPRAKRSHWPSQLTSCRRQLTWGFTDPEEWQPSFRNKITFGFGHSFETVLKKKFEEAEILKGDEEGFSLHDERLAYPINGYVDLIIQLPGEEVLRPVELKTMKASQYDDADYGTMSFPGGRSKPKTYHFAQLLMYMRKMEVDWGVLAYTNKNTSEYTFYKVYYSEEAYERIVAHLIEAEKEKKLCEEDSDHVVPAIMLNDDLEEYEIKDVAITVYKRNTKDNEIGDLKPDKNDKPNGKVGFPCVWRERETGEWNTCDYFGRCWSDKLTELDLTMDDLNGK